MTGRGNKKKIKAPFVPTMSSLKNPGSRLRPRFIRVYVGC